MSKKKKSLRDMLFNGSEQGKPADGGQEEAAPFLLDKVELNFASDVEKMAHTPVTRCYQCQTCSNGCPFSQAMDYRPNAMMRLLQLGMRSQALASSTIWICVGCHTCSSACPMGIDLAAVMDTLRHMALQERAPIAEPAILGFHREVLRSIERYGRTHKLEIMMRYKVRQRDFFGDMDVGMKMLAKRKLDLRPSKVNDLGEVRDIFSRPWQD